MSTKLKFVYILVIFAAFSCENADVIKGTGVGFIKSFGTLVEKKDNTPAIVTIAVSGIIKNPSAAYITITDTSGISTNPPYDSTGVLTLNFEPGESEKTFTVDYENPEIEVVGRYDIDFKISQVDGDITQIFNDTYVMRLNGPIDISEAKKMEIGEKVTVTGYVMTPDFGGSGGQYFIQDATGGIGVFHALNHGIVSKGDSVEVTGLIDAFNDQVQIEPGEVRILKRNVTIPQPTTIGRNDLTLESKYQGTLVQISNVVVLDTTKWPTKSISGSGLSVPGYVSGTTFTIRIDGGQSIYDGSPIPCKGKIQTLTGILSHFRTEIQIMPFVEGDAIYDTCIFSNLFLLPFLDDFENCASVGQSNLPENWIESFVAGSKTDRGWGCDTNDGVSSSSSIRATSFNGEVGTDNAWLISAKKFGLINTTTASLSFDIKSTVSGSGSLKVLWSENYTGGDPAVDNWTELTEAIPKLPTQGSSTYKNISVTLDGAVGKNVFLAFQFFGGTDASSASYDIDNLNVTSTVGGGGNTDPFTLPFTDDFESCAKAGDFEIPSNWIELVAAGSKEDRGWGCRAFGKDGTSGPRASTFGGADGSDDAWLISAKPFDLTGATNPELVFWLESRFTGPGDIKVYWASDFDGSSLTSGTWNELTDVISQVPAENSVTFTEITSDLSVITETKVYLAFRYFGGTSAASEAFTIDDLSIENN